MITVKDYFMGRDIKYASELTQEIKDNAVHTVDKVNLLLAEFYKTNPKAVKRGVNSGWRPSAVNATTAGAAKKSNHLLGLACDVADQDGELDAWCMKNTAVLEKIGLWMEHPKDTIGWCHLQIVPPKSGNRVFAAK